MALDKQSIKLNFAGGIDSLEDPNQLALGKFTALSNTQFIKRAEGGISSLDKRFGFGSFTRSVGTMSYVTTFNNNLVGVGTSPNNTQAVFSYSDGLSAWNASGSISLVQVSVTPLVRNTFSQAGADAAVDPSGLICTAYNAGELVITTAPATSAIKYAILDYSTGQNVILPTQLLAVGSNSIMFPPKIFSFRDKFVILYGERSYTASSSATGSVFSLLALSFPSNQPSSLGSITTISSNCNFRATGGFDGVVSSGNLYVSWNRGPPAGTGTDDGTAIAYLNNTMVRSAIVNYSALPGYVMSICADGTVGSNSTIYTVFSAGSAVANSAATIFSAADSNLVAKFPPKVSISSGSLTIMNVASTAQGGGLQAYTETAKNYVYDATIKTNAISTYTMASSGSFGVSVIGSETVISRCLGLASKGFINNSISYVLGAYQSTYQPTYFLLDSGGNPSLKLAYGNGGGYLGLGLPSVTMGSQSFHVPYLFKNSITSVNKGTNLPTTEQTAGIYSSLGVNLASINFSGTRTITKDAGKALNINGGFLWSYDGLRATENNFFLYPDDIKVTAINTGNLTAQDYFYVVTYEYTDNQSNIYRSAPSIPKKVNIAVTGSSGVIQGPNLRLTYKGSPNYPSINVYRWSTAQPVYYRVTGPPSILSVPAVQVSDSFLLIDGAADATILGNEILYTNGGVVENTGGPPTSTMAIFDSRVWLVDAEDKDLLWYSKQIIEATPVEMSDLLTYFVQPNAGTQNPTGPIQQIAPMDDKLIVFKRNAIYYINGIGPDNTGANSQYSEAIFINGSIGCLNKNSVVLTPNGLMFQSDNGIWMLGRDLSLKFIGKDVEDFNNSNVISSLYVPGTAEVRFSLDTGEILVYDYAADNWGVDYGAGNISSTIYKNLHTFVNSSNSMFQETVGSYVDGSTPTTFSFTTGWINFAGLQGFARLYELYMLGTFKSAHQLTVGIAYDYNSAIAQTTIINPTNTIGSGSTVEQWQINLSRQQCQAIQLTVTETSSASAGAGVSISGFNMVVGLKKQRPQNIAIKNRTS